VGAADDERAIGEVRAALGEAVDALTRASAADEALARYEPPTRRMLVTRKSRMVPLGRVWRLGVVLLDADGRLYATGSTTRAVDPKWPQHVAVSAEERRDRRGAAFRGPFAPGETVDFDAEPIELTPAGLTAGSSPVFLDGGRVLVRWAPGDPGLTRGFVGYLREHVALAVDPPAGDGRTAAR